MPDLLMYFVAYFQKFRGVFKILVRTLKPINASSELHSSIFYYLPVFTNIQMNNKNDSFDEFWQGIDILKQKQSPINLIKRPKIGVQQQLFKWLKPNENKINANVCSTSPTCEKFIASVSSPSSIHSCSSFSSSSNSSPPTKRSRIFKRRQHQKLVEFESGLKGFPSLQNNNSHLLVYVVSVNKGVDELGKPFINLKCELATGSVSSKMHKINVYLRDSWVVETPELCTRQLLRLIEPNKINENTFEICDSSADSCGGLLIVEPETLISSTQLSQAHYCPRKAMFQDRFRSTDTTIAMTVGTIAHELFQIALDLLPSELSAEWLFNFYRKHFLTKICPDLVGMDCSLVKFEEELRRYLENISDWIKSHHPHYKNEKKNNQPIAQIRQQNIEDDENNDPNLPNEPFFYSETVDIEENIWTPTIGFKGRIDVSFMGGGNTSPCSLSDSNQSPLSINKQSKLVVPLELKTGRSYGSSGCVEHQTQVMLYSLMLSERVNNGQLSLGFLLYLRDNKIAPIHPKAVQLRGIIQMRNRLATHFSKFTIDSFPDPLRNPRSCINCPYATLCSTIALGNEISSKEGSSKNKTQKSRLKKFLSPKNNNEDFMVVDEIKQNGVVKIANDKPQRTLKNKISEEMYNFMLQQTAHLNQQEILQINNWIKNGLEGWGKAWENGSTLRLFRKTPKERELFGTCLANMRLISSNCTKNDVDDFKNSFLLFFTRESNEKITELENFQLKVGTTITISTNNAYALLIAKIHSIDVSTNSVFIISDKDLSKNIPGKEEDDQIYYHLDKHDGFTSYALALGNISGLLENSQKAKLLRSILMSTNNNTSTSKKK
uniref:DNA replication ATP-dependent helicase/nuclease DNA2 n=2 Tax=Meloidogyne TaxID=189290 RepID=A0A914N7H3_MELIC